MNLLELKYKSWEENLWKDYNKIFKNVKYTITDGVISPIDYHKSPIKIMFLNREPYDDKFTSYSLNNAIREQLENGIKIFKRQSTFRRNLRDDMAMVGLMERNLAVLTDKDAETEHDCWDNDRFEQRMYSSAYVNIKKSNGQFPSSEADLRFYVRKGLEIIKRQIAYFNPTIILGGNVITSILDEEPLDWGETLYKAPGILNVYELIINAKVYPIMDLYHPSATYYKGGSMSEYYREIFKALKSVELSHPNYWLHRMNEECF